MLIYPRYATDLRGLLDLGGHKFQPFPSFPCGAVFAGRRSPKGENEVEGAATSPRNEMEGERPRNVMEGVLYRHGIRCIVIVRVMVPSLERKEFPC